MSTFITATQTWVKKRIDEVLEHIERVKTGLGERIVDAWKHTDDEVGKVREHLANMATKVVTGGLRVEGEALITGPTNIAAPVTAQGLVSTAPISCTDPAGLLLKVPGRPDTGLNATTLSLMNDKGKIARIFLRGDKLYYDYPYDKIYTYFNKEIPNASLRYLHRGSTSLAQIVENVQQYGTDLERTIALEEWFNKPEHGHKEVRLFNTSVNECFPAIATPFMIPESMLFQVPELYKIENIKLLDANGQLSKILKDFRGRTVRKLLINFPFVRSMTEDPITSAPAIREPGPQEVPAVDKYTSFPVALQHIADFENGYYEVTDPDARFHETIDHGLIPNVILKLDDFPRDQISVIYFNVVQA